MAVDTNKATSPLRAIRAKCLDCCCDQPLEIKLCPCTKCPLHPFRMGKNPFYKRSMTEEQRIAAAERFRKYREKNKEQIDENSND